MFLLSIDTIKDTDAKLSDASLDQIGGLLSIKIGLCNKSGSLEVYGSDSSIFGTPIVIYRDKDIIDLLYTRSQAYCFSKDSDKSAFAKADKKEESKLKEKLDNEAKKTKEFENLINISMEFVKTLTEGVGTLIDGINEYGQNNPDINDLQEGIEILSKIESHSKDLLKDPLMKNNYGKIESKIANHIKKISNCNEIPNIMKKLSTSKAKTKEVEKKVEVPIDLGKCSTCKKKCEAHCCLKLKCKHVVCEMCLSK